MTIRELLENAQLDAMGLLDDREREEFDLAFQSAPPAVRDQIRREQTRLCRIEYLLPQVSPPAGLWARVLAAVRAARTESSELAGVRHDGADRLAHPLPMIRARGVHRLWRASTLGLAAAVVVIGGAFINLQSAANIERRAADREAMAAELGRSFGREYLTEQLFGTQTAKHILTAAKPGSVGKAAVYTNPQWDHAMLYCQSVAAGTGRTLRVVALDEDGNVLEQLAEFESSGELMAVTITLGTVQTTQLAIIAAPRGLSAGEGELLMRMT